MAESVDGGAAIAALGFELGVLKRMRRTGWWHAGVRDPESVAEHSMRAAQLAGLIAAQEGADPARASLLALWHDTQETRTGDLPHTARPYLTKPEPRAITADQTAELPAEARDLVRGVVDEYETRDTLAAQCAADADKLEMLLQPSSTGTSACTGSMAGSTPHVRVCVPERPRGSRTRLSLSRHWPGVIGEPGRVL